MKKCSAFIIATMILTLAGCAHMAAAQPEDKAREPVQAVEETKPATETADKPKTVKEAVEQLKPDDPRKAKVEVLTWRIKYLQEHLRAIELEYTGLCFKDTRHRQSSLELQKLNRELRQLLLIK